MSLINKMLQDLDARGKPAGEALPGQVKPVERERRRVNLKVVGACVGGVSAGVALAWFGVHQYGARHATGPKPMAIVESAPVAAMPAPPPAVTAAAVATAPAAAPAVAAAPPASLPSSLPAASVPAAPAPSAPAALAATPARTIAPLEPDGAEARAARIALNRELGARRGAAAPPQARKAAPADDVAAPDDIARAQPAQGRHADNRQRAESEYRRALASLQEGRIGETVAALEGTLRLEPAHEAARQTLVGLLVESGRQDEAMRQAQTGLTLDPRQPALAMLLARLQMEHGGNGIDTLTRTLPYAGNNADYRAFYAGALERQGRHREAAEQYGAALRINPSNGIWWMGLGIALQGDKRDGEALDAFRRARAAGMSSPELQEFVERRVQQLGR